MVADKQKRIERAQRFGTISSEAEIQKRKERQEKFGTGKKASALSGGGIRTVSTEELEKRKQRVERFGLPGNEKDDEVLKKRQERFKGMLGENAVR